MLALPGHTSEQRTDYKPKSLLDSKSPIQVRIHFPPADSQCLDGIRVPSSAAGRRIGGKPFSRGALYLMLQNRIYRGEIATPGRAFHNARSRLPLSGAACSFPFEATAISPSVTDAGASRHSVIPS